MSPRKERCTAPLRTAPHRTALTLVSTGAGHLPAAPPARYKRERGAEGTSRFKRALLMLWPVGSCVAVTRGTSRLLVCWSSCRKEGWCSPQSSCCGEESLASVMAQVRRACMSRGWRTLRPRRRGPRALRPGELPTRRAALTRNPTRPALRRRQNPSERAPAARPDAVWLQQRLGECQIFVEGVQRARGRLV